MKIPAQWSEDNLLSMASIIGKASVRTQYACQVVNVSEDGRFVDVVHNTLEWQACSDGDTIMLNEFGKDVLCSPVKPWVITDVPVEETYERGQWKVRVRPKIGDRGILSVFYHDIKSLKEKGGFQAPEAIRVMAIDSASFRPGLPNHADVNAEETPYPSDDEWELVGNGVSIKASAPSDSESGAKQQIEIKAGNNTITITATGDDSSTIKLESGSYSFVVDDTGEVVETTPNKTLNATTGVNIKSPTTVIDGVLQVTTGASGVIYTGAQVITVVDGIITSIS